MSMTRGNAHQYLKKVYLTTKNDSYREALSVALSALRPVSREQVERIRGEWIEYEHPHIICCTRCDYGTGPKEKTRFCPYCGAPMTDEAVEMVMERLEALHESP